MKAHCGFLGVILVILAAAPLLAGQGQVPAPSPAQGQGRGQPSASPPRQAGHPSGKLLLWGDIALFVRPGEPDGCILSNRYRRGQRVGFRMTAIDGGTGEVENTAVLVAHVTYAGRTIDVPMRWRGEAGPAAPPPRGVLRPPGRLRAGHWAVAAGVPPGS